MKSVIFNFLKRMKYPIIFVLILICVHILFLSCKDEIDKSLIEIYDWASKIVFIIGFTWLLIRIIGYGKDLLLIKYDISEEDNLKARKVYTQFSLVQRVINFVVIIIAISLVLLNFEEIRKLGLSLLASAGIAGIIIGFAAQKLIATVLAGLQIAITQPIRIEDVVIVEGEWGWIEEITLTYVVVRIWDKRRLIVPTTYFIEKPFQNWTRTTAEILGTVFIYTDYTVPVDEVRAELTRILNNDDNWDGKVNVLQVTDATEKTMELRALVSAKNSPAAWDLRVSVREKLIQFLQNKYPESLPKSRIMLDKN